MSGYEFIAVIMQSVTSFILLVALLLIWLQHRKTQQEFKSRMRPYLGFYEIKNFKFIRDDRLEFEVYISNTGSLPAKNVTLSGQCLLDGSGSATFESPTKGAVFPSGKPEKWAIGITDIKTATIISIERMLTVELKVDYYSPTGGHFWTSKKGVWDIDREEMTNVEDDFI